MSQDVSYSRDHRSRTSLFRKPQEITPLEICSTVSSNPAPKIDLSFGDLEGRLDKEPAKNVKKNRVASRESRENARRLINMRYNLAFVCVSGIDSGLKIICLFSFLFVEWIFADFRLYYYKMRYNLASEPVCGALGRLRCRDPVL